MIPEVFKYGSSYPDYYRAIVVPRLYLYENFIVLEIDPVSDPGGFNWSSTLKISDKVNNLLEQQQINIVEPEDCYYHITFGNTYQEDIDHFVCKIKDFKIALPKDLSLITVIPNNVSKKIIEKIQIYKMREALE